jgi:transposase
MAVRYVVTLTESERNKLHELISKNKANRNAIVNAFIVLKADKACGWSNQDIAQAYHVSTKKVEQVKKRFVEEGYEAALYRKPVTNTHRRKMTGDEEAHVIALCCSEPPEGRATWTLRLLADKMVECHMVNSLSHETVRQTLKK